ncbi:MAG: hypothetical protein ABI419_02800 [Ginsengibacter sp.]
MDYNRKVDKANGFGNCFLLRLLKIKYYSTKSHLMDGRALRDDSTLAQLPFAALVAINYYL